MIFQYYRYFQNLCDAANLAVKDTSLLHKLFHEELPKGPIA